MRRTFKAADSFEVGAAVQWRHGSHWRAGVVTGPVERDVLGFDFYPVRDCAPSTRTITTGEAVRGYPGSIRRPIGVRIP